MLSFLVASCISNRRINYLQNLSGNDPIGLDEFIPYADVDYEYVLQPFDIIDIDFASANEELLKAFEYQGANSARMGRGGMGAMGGAMDIFYFSGYPIDKDGFIRMPILGLIQVAGLSPATGILAPVLWREIGPWLVVPTSVFAYLLWTHSRFKSPLP
jgi:polysaccharide export outer membrane protein